MPSAVKEERTLVLYLISAAPGSIRPYFTALLLFIAVAFKKLHWMLSPPEFAKSNHVMVTERQRMREGNCEVRWVIRYLIFPTPPQPSVLLKAHAG